MWSASEYEPPVAPAWLNLRHDETMLWMGQPTSFSLLVRPQGIALTAAGLVWIGITASSLVPALSSGSFGLAFVFLFHSLPGVYLSIGRHLVNWYLRSHTNYVLTSQRVIIRRTGIRPETREVPLIRVTEMHKSLKRDGSGTIWLRSTYDIPVRYQRQRQWYRLLHEMDLDQFQLFRIPNAAAVIHLLENASNYNLAVDDRPLHDGKPMPSPYREA